MQIYIVKKFGEKVEIIRKKYLYNCINYYFLGGFSYFIIYHYSINLMIDNKYKLLLGFFNNAYAPILFIINF
jgi:hypothetical protein